MLTKESAYQQGVTAAVRDFFGKQATNMMNRQVQKAFFKNPKLRNLTMPQVGGSLGVGVDTPKHPSKLWDWLSGLFSKTSAA